jgi:hypothetical protein
MVAGGGWPVNYKCTKSGHQEKNVALLIKLGVPLEPGFVGYS